MTGRGRTDFLNGIRDKAQQRIKKGAFEDAVASKAEIDQLCAGIARTFGGVISAAPLKSEDRAGQKVAMDYGGDWFGIKDLARLTIIVPTTAGIQGVLGELRRKFSASQGRGIVQIKEVLPTADPCGYSSTTVFVRTSNDRFAEIQINIPEVIYAKQSESSFVRALGQSMYSSIKARYQLDGGLGHVLYEVYRVAPGSPRGLAAANLSKAYYNYFRAVPNLQQRDKLKQQLAELDLRH